MTPLPIIKLVVIFIKTLGRITRPARWARFTTIITAIHIEKMLTTIAIVIVAASQALGTGHAVPWEKDVSKGTDHD
jgi:hypothetical protein